MYILYEAVPKINRIGVIGRGENFCSAWFLLVEACRATFQQSVHQLSSLLKVSFYLCNFFLVSFCALVVLLMADFYEQRMAVKFCLLLGKTNTETLEMLKAAFKEDAMG